MKGAMLSRLIAILMITLSLTLAGCDTGGDDEIPPPEDPRALLEDSASLMQEADTFRLEVTVEGAPFNFLIDLGDGEQDVRFNRAIGQFVNPGEVEATVSVNAGATFDIAIYADGPEQWFRAPLIGWINSDFASGFDPSRIIKEGGGFEAAVAALREIVYEGISTVDGIGTFHFSGIATGSGLTDLLVGLLEIQGDVPVDVYINRENSYPVRLIIRVPETETDQEPEGTQWVVDVFDINEPDEISRPEGS
jgi:hypothetical protein